jgi:hypothetical protein
LALVLAIFLGRDGYRILENTFWVTQSMIALHSKVCHSDFLADGILQNEKWRELVVSHEVNAGVAAMFADFRSALRGLCDGNGRGAESGEAEPCSRNGNRILPPGGGFGSEDPSVNREMTCRLMVEDVVDGGMDVEKTLRRSR